MIHGLPLDVVCTPAHQLNLHRHLHVAKVHIPAAARACTWRKDMSRVHVAHGGTITTGTLLCTEQYLLTEPKKNSTTVVLLSCIPKKNTCVVQA